MRLVPRFEEGELLLRKVGAQWQRVWVEKRWTLNLGPEPVDMVQVRVGGHLLNVAKDQVGGFRGPLLASAGEALLEALGQPPSASSVDDPHAAALRALDADELATAAALVPSLDPTVQAYDDPDAPSVRDVVVCALVEELTASLQRERSAVEAVVQGLLEGDRPPGV